MQYGLVKENNSFSEGFGRLRPGTMVLRVFDPELGHLAFDYPGIGAVRPRAQGCSVYVGQLLSVQTRMVRWGGALYLRDHLSDQAKRTHGAQALVPGDEPGLPKARNFSGVSDTSRIVPFKAIRRRPNGNAAVGVAGSASGLAQTRLKRATRGRSPSR